MEEVKTELESPSLAQLKYLSPDSGSGYQLNLICKLFE